MGVGVSYNLRFCYRRYGRADGQSEDPIFEYGVHHGAMKDRHLLGWWQATRLRELGDGDRGVFNPHPLPQ